MERRKKSRYSRIILLLTILLVVILTISLTLLYYLNQFKKPVKTLVLKTNVTISEHKIAFDLGHNDSINFGTIKRGSESKRSLILYNTFNFPVKAEISCNGSICNLLLFDNEVYLQPKSQKDLEFLAKANPFEVLGYKEGNITIEIYRAVVPKNYSTKP
ncbi:MAG: hypothetical protein PWP03_654 [Candidatus Woesearchaeota archaeon]|nr:hypothetical protein [Candidatus Woesearchaeota archaeon]MDN5328016.1 hypothetical protein [Candidatus Woesearchaeota archaeon]